MFDDWRELVNLPEVDAVVVTAWPDTRAPVVIAALEAGKHVLCEAAMAVDRPSAQAMYEASRQRPHLKTLLSSMATVARGDATARKLISDGFVGRVLQVVDYRMDGRYADPTVPLHWRQSRQSSGVNFQFLGERFNVIRRWLGDHRGVFALAKTFDPNRPGATSQGQLPDTMNVLAELEDGTPVSYIHSGIARFAGQARLEIYGTEGTLVYGLDGPPWVEEIHGARADETALHPIPLPDDAVRRETVDEAFIAMIREDKEPSPELSTFYDGMKYVEFLTACFLSAERGAWVDLPLP